MTIDIEPKIIAQMKVRIHEAGLANVTARVADVYRLPFEDHTFDAIYMIAVIGEIPKPELALREFHRVLSPGGVLAFSELLSDPDYPRASTLTHLASETGFVPKHQLGNFFSYTLNFVKA